MRHFKVLIFLIVLIPNSSYAQTVMRQVCQFVNDGQNPTATENGVILIEQSDPASIPAAHLINWDSTKISSESNPDSTRPVSFKVTVLLNENIGLDPSQFVEKSEDLFSTPPSGAHRTYPLAVGRRNVDETQISLDGSKDLANGSHIRWSTDETFSAGYTDVEIHDARWIICSDRFSYTYPEEPSPDGTDGTLQKI